MYPYCPCGKNYYLLLPFLCIAALVYYSPKHTQRRMRMGCTKLFCVRACVCTVKSLQNLIFIRIFMLHNLSFCNIKTVFQNGKQNLIEIGYWNYLFIVVEFIEVWSKYLLLSLSMQYFSIQILSTSKRVCVWASMSKQVKSWRENEEKLNKGRLQR